MIQPRSNIIITRAVQTSIACPSQWDLYDADDNYYYARFRHGCGSLRQYTTSDWVDAPESALVGHVASFQREIPDDPDWVYDGDISLEEFAQRAGFTLALESYTSFGDHVRDELVTNGLLFLLSDEEKGNRE